MKSIPDFDRTMSVTAHDGGYVIANHELGGRKTVVRIHFEHMVNELAQAFGLLEVGERVIISSTKEPQENACERR